MKLLTPILVTLSLLGCSSTDTELAKDNQWELLGFKDGTNGQHQRSSTELTFLNVVDKSQVEKYNNGFVRGNAEYCDVEAIYESGLNGAKYNGQCRHLANEPEIVSAWHEGYEEYLVTESMLEITSD